MKRIKNEEIQETIRNYLKQRNVTPTRVGSWARPAAMTPQNIDFTQIVTSDMTLLESSINDYYAYCLNSSSFHTDYLREFHELEKFVDKSESCRQNESLRQLLHPILVYICIDLIGLGFSIKGKLLECFQKVKDDEIKSLVDDLIAFEESKGQQKSKKILDLVDNKWRISLTAGDSRRFLNFLINSKCYLLLRIVNLNLQIVMVKLPECDPSDWPPVVAESKLLKPNNTQETDSHIKPNPGTNDTSISLQSLRDCIQMIRSKPPTINGACCFYVTDPNHKITSSAVSPDHRFASFTAEDSTIYVYDLQANSSTNSSSSQLVGGHSTTVLKSKFTHDSDYIISCDFEGLVGLWRTKDGGLITTYSGHLYPVWDLEPYSTLNLFATGSKDGTARLWSFDRMYPLRVYAGHQADVNCVRFHPNASYLATGSSDKTVRLWSVQSSEFVRLFSGHRGRVFALAFSPDGNYLASAGEDRKIKIWDLRMGSLLRELRGHANFIHSLAFDNHSQLLCSGGFDRTVKFWDVQSCIKQAPTTSTSNPKHSPHSTELFNSINVDFDVYSIAVDTHNVFYLSGARKTRPEIKPEKTEKPDSKQDIEPEKVLPTQAGKKTGVSTRKASAANSKPSTSAASSSATVNYDFLNNDDLYEV